MKKKPFIFHFILFLGSIFLCSATLFAQLKIPPKPKKQTAVYDSANLLSENEENILEQKLIRYADTTSTQIVIATVTSLQGEYIALYATEWAQQWGIGQAKEDNGLLILVAKEDRELFITTGYGLEEKLTDFNTKTIIDQIITPQFKKGQFYLGLDKGTTAIFQVLDGTFKGGRRQHTISFPWADMIFPIVIFVIIVIAFSNKKGGNSGGNRGNRSFGGGLLDVIILSNMGRGGFGSGSGGGSLGGGGFGGGFGGGGFGGGGAGGSW